jgi:Ca-activated chloride channel family protein
VSLNQHSISEALRVRRAAALVVFLVWGAGVFYGSDQSTPAARQEAEVGSAQAATARPLRVDVQLALINVSVYDPYDRFVTGLKPEYFQVYEDNRVQTISQFSSEDVPISIGVIFDASGSMADKIKRSRQAIAQFFRTSNPDDEFFLISFNDRPSEFSGFTHDPATLQNKLNFTPAKGRTSLLDAVYLGLSEMHKAQYSRKVILIVSDGGDNHSSYTEQDIKRLVKEAGVQIYAVGIYEPFADRGRTPEELNGPSLLTEIAEMTGGRQFSVEDPNDLPDITNKISRELRSVYVLGYSPTNTSSDGKWRKIRVKVRLPKGLPSVQLFAKSGYYAPVR